MKEYKYKVNGNEYTVGIGDIDNNTVEVEVNGKSYTVELEKTASAPVVSAIKPAVAAPPAAQPAARPSTGAPGALKSPLPGVILDIKVNVGDTVEPSTVVAILEAMKMENTINAGRSGVVKAINVNKGDSVLEGTELIVIE